MTKKKAEGGFASMLNEKFDFQPEVMLGGCHLELRGRCSLAVGGCRGIVAYSPTEIVLRLKKGFLRVNGADLCCDSYMRGEVIVSGRVDTIGFEDRAE